ncbi:MAG: hypothetical protein AABX07_04655 [Nanoarchaeota archaeon]
MKLTFLGTRDAFDEFSLRNGYIFAISGDGDFTDETRELFKGVDLLIHDAYSQARPAIGHASALDILNFAMEEKIAQVALVHRRRDEWADRGNIREIRRVRKAGIKVVIPEDGDSLKLKRLPLRLSNIPLYA